MCPVVMQLRSQKAGHSRAHLDPNVKVPTHAAYFVLELLALPQAVLRELCLVSDELRRRPEILLLQLLCFPEDLLGCDLCQVQANSESSSIAEEHNMHARSVAT